MVNVRRQRKMWARARNTLNVCRQAWQNTGGCLVPDCDVRAMNFPLSRDCETHTVKGWVSVKLKIPRTR